MHSPGESPSACCVPTPSTTPWAGLCRWSLCNLLGAHTSWTTGTLGLNPLKMSGYIDKQMQGKADLAILRGCSSVLLLKGSGTSHKATRAKVFFSWNQGWWDSSGREVGATVYTLLPVRFGASPFPSLDLDPLSAKWGYLDSSDGFPTWDS